MNRLGTEKRTQIIRCLVEGMSIRATVRLTGAAKNTVTNLLRDMGCVCAQYQDRAFRNLTCKRIQVDEIWSFCYAKDKNVPSPEKRAEGAGDVWTWTAIDAETKLIPCWMVGGRNAYYAELFMHDLAGRLNDPLPGFHWCEPERQGERMAIDNLAECRRLLRMYWLAVEAGKGVELTDGEDERFDGMIWKVFVHAATAVHIADTAIPLPHDATKTYIDVPSLFTVTRAAFEGAVALQYVMLAPGSDQLRRFRVLVWKLGGFLERKDMLAITEEGKRVKADDAEEAERLRTELRKDPVFLGLKEKRQKEALKGKWRDPHSWPNAAAQVGYDLASFTDIYRLLSSVAHSSGLSAYLAWMLKGVDAQRDHAKVAMSMLRVPIAKVILAYVRRFPSARVPLDAEPEEAELIEICASLDDRSDLAKAE